MISRQSAVPDHSSGVAPGFIHEVAFTSHVPTIFSISACCGPGVEAFFQAAISWSVKGLESAPAGLALAWASCQGAAATRPSAPPASTTPAITNRMFMTVLLVGGNWQEPPGGAREAARSVGAAARGRPRD